MHRDQPRELLGLPCRVSYFDSHTEDASVIIVVLGPKAYREGSVRIQKQFPRSESSPEPAHRIGQGCGRQRMSAETGHLAAHLNGVTGDEYSVNLVKGKVVGREDELVHDDSFRRVHAFAGDPDLEITIPLA